MSVLTRQVLLLNSHFEAIGTIGVLRAIVLEMKKKVRVERIDPTRFVHSTAKAYAVPSVVVQTTAYVNVRKRRSQSNKQRLRIFIRDKFRCQYCTKRFQASELTLDHILPRSQQGSDEAENLATSCYPCNQRKGSRTPDEARMPLLATPSALRYGLDKALLAHYAETRPEWRPYLFLDDIALAG